jgi:hypothetical protein
VDAYPVQDGHIVEGLKPEDFEVLEDGKPQAIESFDFIRFDAFSPADERLDPHTKQESFEMAKDPRNRVFVIFVDMVTSGRIDVHYIQEPLVAFMKRVLGPRDLFGFVTSRNSANDLVLSGVSTVVEAQVRDLFRSVNIDKDDADVFVGCPFPDGVVAAMKYVYRLDQSYATIEGLVRELGALRQERKSIVLVSNWLSRNREYTKLRDAVAGQMPRVGITQGGWVSATRTGRPRPTADSASERSGSSSIAFDQRYRALLRDAEQNVVLSRVHGGRDGRRERRERRLQ